MSGDEIENDQNHRNVDELKNPLEYKEEKARDIEKHGDEIFYSERYYDDFHEYRHVVLPKALVKYVKNPEKLMSETEWRSLGVKQSIGWEHYMIHKPEPHILLFRREKDFQLKYGNNPPPLPKGKA